MAAEPLNDWVRVEDNSAGPGAPSPGPGIAHMPVPPIVVGPNPAVIGQNPPPDYDNDGY